MPKCIYDFNFIMCNSCRLIYLFFMTTDFPQQRGPYILSSIFHLLKSFVLFFYISYCFKVKFHWIILAIFATKLDVKLAVFQICWQKKKRKRISKWQMMTFHQKYCTEIHRTWSIISLWTFTTLWANSADNKLTTFFFLFSPENRLTRHANCLLRGQYFKLTTDYFQIVIIAFTKNSLIINITKTHLYNIDPLKPHFYIVKLGFTGVYIIFLISAQNIDCGYSLEPSHMFWAEIWKISEFFIWNFHVFLVVKFSVYLNRHVFVMGTHEKYIILHWCCLINVVN